MFRRPIRLARFFGIDVFVPPIWFLFAALVCYFIHGIVARDFTQLAPTARVLFSLMLTIVLYACIALHELGHAAVAKLRYRMQVAGIVLNVLSGTTGYRDQAQRPGQAAAVALAGPAVSLFLAVATIGVLALLNPAIATGAKPYAVGGTADPLLFVLWTGGLVNSAMFLLNMLPALPLDGGHALQALGWKLTGDRMRGTRVAAWGGRLVAVGLFALAFLLGTSGEIFGAIMLGLVGMMIFATADATVRRMQVTENIRNLSIRDLMSADPLSVPGQLTIGAALRDVYLPNDRRTLPVVTLGGEYLGMVATDQLLAVPRVQWEATTMQAFCRERIPDPKSMAVDIFAHPEELMMKMQVASVSALAVLESGRLVGTISREQVFKGIGLHA